jgi:hypothetical protein
MRQNQFSIPYSTLSIVHRDIPAEIYYPFHPISRREISTTAPLYVSGTLITTIITTRCQNSQKTPSSIASTAPGNSNSWREQEQEEQEESGEEKKTEENMNRIRERESLQLLLLPTTRRCEYKQISDGELHRFVVLFFSLFLSPLQCAPSSKREAA